MLHTKPCMVKTYVSFLMWQHYKCDSTKYPALFHSNEKYDRLFVYDRTDVSGGINVNKIGTFKELLLVTIGTFYIKDLSFNHLSVPSIMYYSLVQTKRGDG